MNLELWHEFWQDTMFEFNDLGDYIWKFNKHIDAIREEEISKLDAYFPDDPKLRAYRWLDESRKLDHSFPTALNYSFVVLVYITLETRLLRICSLLHESRKLPLRAKDLSGSGLERSMAFLEKLGGLSRQRLPLWTQIRKLATIRNCIVHTSGFLEYSNDKKELLALIKDQSYLSKENRERLDAFERKEKRVVPVITTVQVQCGERLFAAQKYASFACCYGRDFLMSVLEEIKSSWPDPDDKQAASASLHPQQKRAAGGSDQTRSGDEVRPVRFEKTRRGREGVSRFPHAGLQCSGSDTLTRGGPRRGGAGLAHIQSG